MVSCDKPNKSEWFRVRGKTIKDVKKGISVCMAAADGKEHDFMFSVLVSFVQE